MLDRCVHDHDDDEAQNGLIERCRRAHAEVGTLKQRAEHIRINDVRCVEQLSVIPDDLIEHLKIAAENAAHVEKQHRDDRRTDGW